MRKLNLALLIALGLSLISWGQAIAQQVGPAVQVFCNKSAQVSVATATTTSIVPGVPNQSIFFCGWHVTSTQSATSTFQFVYGTTAGGPCATPTVLTPAFNVTSTAPSADHISIASVQVPQTAAGNQLCVVSTGATVGLAVEVYYAQFPGS
jgi:hypothetical protein